MKKKTFETFEQYVARGGKVTQLDPVSREEKVDTVRSTTVGPAHLMSLEEGELFFGEKRKSTKPKKVKQSTKIDLDVLPPALRAKFIAKVKETSDAEGYEEEIENLEDVPGEDLEDWGDDPGDED